PTRRPGASGKCLVGAPPRAVHARQWARRSCSITRYLGRAGGNVNALGPDFTYSPYGQSPGNAGEFRSPPSSEMAWGSHEGRMRVAWGSHEGGLRVARCSQVYGS